MKHILFSDLDGTLIKEGHQEIHRKNFEMMRELQNQGHVVVLSTGRNNVDILPTLKHNNIPYDYLILSNGGLILDKNHKIIIENKIPTDIAKKLLKIIIENKELSTYFSNGHECIGFKEGNVRLLTKDGLKDTNENVMSFIDNSNTFHIIGINQINMKIDLLNKLIEEHLEPLKDNLSWCFNLQYVDIIPHNCSKGSGVKLLMEYLNIPESKSHTIGDSFNDISMFEMSDYSYTFNHAEEVIKNSAKKTVNYVYEVCQEILEK